jgi:hypothetical protein
MDVPKVRIGFSNQQEMVGEAVQRLVELNPRQGVNLIVPPAFEPAVVARQLRAALENHKAYPLLAFFEIDTVFSMDSFVIDLYRQWRKAARREGAPNDGAADRIVEPDSGIPAHEKLFQLLASLRDIRRPVVILFDRFHKLPFKKEMGDALLGQLRTAEDSDLLNTATVSPLSYRHLKLRWPKDHPLTVSDFGRSHLRLEARVNPLSAEEEHCRKLGLPEHIIRFALAVTGGYPEPCNAVLDEWRRRGQNPNLEPTVKAIYRNIAEQATERLIEWLDAPGDSTYRDAVVNLYQEVEADQAADRLVGHPYENILLSDGELRAECVGGAAVRLASHSPADVGEMAQRQYARGQYYVASQLMKRVPDGAHRISLGALRAHARVMAALYREEGTQNGLDLEWRELTNAIDLARSQIDVFRSMIKDAVLLDDRYRTLEDLAKAVLQQSHRGNTLRIIDTLAGLDGFAATPEDHLNAFRLIVRHAELARAVRGPTSACLIALAIPEQVFRVWAFLRLGINYYHAPSGKDEVWEDAERAWVALRKTPLRRPQAGQTFGSLPALAYFALASSRRLAPTPDSPPLDDTFEGLQKKLSHFEVRTDLAHALVPVRKADRVRYFELIDHWLNRAITACCPGRSLKELKATFDPLPLIDDNGGLIYPWS